MSHVAVVEVKIKDLASLKAACKVLGLDFKEGQKTFKWWGRWVNDFHGANAAYKQGFDPKTYGQCEHAIGIKDDIAAYEIGVVKVPTKGKDDGKTDAVIFSLMYDFYGTQGQAIEKVAGKGCTKLAQTYAQEVAKKHLVQQGYSLGQTKVAKDGTIEMQFNNFNLN